MAAHILTLPVEMLQHIIDFCTMNDLYNLRLVNRAIDVTVLDIFAKQWISKQWCFLLDPKCLADFQRIFSFPRLANRLKFVSFCLDPPSIGVRWDPGHPSIVVEYNKHSGPPERDSLVAILSQLDDMKCQTLAIDLDLPFGKLEGTEFAKKMHLTVEAILRAGSAFGIHELHMLNMVCRPADLLSALRCWAPTLKYVYLQSTSLRFDEDEENGDPWRDVFRALSSCSQLELLHLVDLRHCGIEDTDEYYHGDSVPVRIYDAGWQYSGLGTSLRNREAVAAFLRQYTAKEMPMSSHL